MKNSSNASKQAAMESKADSKGSLANKGWRAGEPGEAAERSLLHSLLRFHELSYFLTVIVRLHKFLVKTQQHLSCSDLFGTLQKPKAPWTFVCTSAVNIAAESYVCFHVTIFLKMFERLRAH